MKSIKRLIFAITNNAYLLLVLAVLFWAGNFVIGRAIRADISPIALAFWRWAGASVLATLIALPYLREDWKRVADNWFVVLVLSFLGITVFNTLIYMGLQHTAAVNGLLMQSVMPIIIVVISFLIFKEKVTYVQFAGVIISLAGAFTIISKGNPEIVIQMRINRGDVLVFIAVVCYALYSSLLRKRPFMHPFSFICYTFILGTLMLFPFFIMDRPFINPLEMGTKTIVAIAYVALFPSIISFLCFNRGVELIGPNRAGVFIHLIPVFGSIMAILFLGESLKWFHGIGIICIACGIFLATRFGRKTV